MKLRQKTKNLNELRRQKRTIKKYGQDLRNYIITLQK